MMAFAPVFGRMFPATFDRRVAVAAAAGSVAWLAQGLPYKLGLMLAALAGVALGVLLDCYRRRLVLEEGA